MTKLTTQERWEIRIARKAGMRNKDLTEIYEVSPAAITYAANGREPECKPLATMSDLHTTESYTDHYVPKRCRPILPKPLPGQMIPVPTYKQLTAGR